MTLITGDGVHNNIDLVGAALPFTLLCARPFGSTLPVQWPWMTREEPARELAGQLPIYLS